MANTSCPDYEVYGLVGKNFASQWLVSIPLRELKTGSTVGTITNVTQQKFQLGEVSFLSTVNKRNNSQDNFVLHLKLGIVIPEPATSHPRALFNEIKLVVRCQKRNDLTSLPTRHVAGYYRLVYYKETSKFQYYRAIACLSKHLMLSAVSWVPIITSFKPLTNRA